MSGFMHKIAAITGGGLGIGRAAAIAFAAAGAKVAVIDIGLTEAEETVDLITKSGGEAKALIADISDEIQVKKVMEEIDRKWGRLDVLVNNAGIYRQGDAVSTSLHDWNMVMSVNVTGAFLCSREAVELMLRNKSGVIVNVASEAGLVGIKGQIAYNVSKSALLGLTRSMAIDHAPYIRVNCVCPGTTETPLVEKALSKATEPMAVRRRLESSRPMDRLGKPEEIASAILLLATDSISYCTGAILSVDGGYTTQ